MKSDLGIDVPKDFQAEGTDLPCEVRAKNSVVGTAQRLQDQRLFAAVRIFNDTLRVVGMADEWLGAAKRFMALFERDQISLNKGVDSLDFVREAVRRSFGISQVVPFGRNRQKSFWVSPEQIESIASQLVAKGFSLPINHGI